MTGRASLFRSKSKRVQGWLSEAGFLEFAAARQTLEERYRDMTGVRRRMSDGDVIEYLVRGWPATKRAIKGRE